MEDNKPRAQESTGLVDIVEKIAEMKRKQAETAGSVDMAKAGEGEQAAMELPLRDREFTKEELARLEKKTWIEIKDLIFETEP